MMPSDAYFSHNEQDGQFHLISEQADIEIIMANESIFLPFVSGEIPPDLSKISPNKVMSLVDGELHSQLRRNFIAMVAGKRQELTHYIERMAREGIDVLIRNSCFINVIETKLGSLAPLAVCELLAIPEDDRMPLLHLYRTANDSILRINNEPIQSALEYLNVVISLAMDDKTSMIRQLYFEQYQQGLLSHQDIVFNVSLLIEASLHTVTCETISLLYLAVEGKLGSDITASRSNLGSTPIKYLFRRAKERLSLETLNINKDDIIAISLETPSDSDQKWNRPKFGFGRHRCPGEGLARICLIAFRKVLKERAFTVEYDGHSLYPSHVANIYDKAMFRITLSTQGL